MLLSATGLQGCARLRRSAALRAAAVGFVLLSACSDGPGRSELPTDQSAAYEIPGGQSGSSDLGAIAQENGGNASEGPRDDVVPLTELSGNRPLGFGRRGLSWREAKVWWGASGELLRGEWFPHGTPQEESLYGIDDRERDGYKVLISAYPYRGATAEEDNQWEILKNGGIIVRFVYLPPGKLPWYADPLWTEKVVRVRGHTAKLFEALHSEGANVQFRTVYWEEPSAQEAGAQVQYLVEVDPFEYSEHDTIRLIDAMQVVK